MNSAGIRVLQESLNGESFSYRSSDGRWYEKIEIPLLGRHQINNAALALETLNVIKNYYCISDFQTEDGMQKTNKLFAPSGLCAPSQITIGSRSNISILPLQIVFRIPSSV